MEGTVLSTKLILKKWLLIYEEKMWNKSTVANSYFMATWKLRYSRPTLTLDEKGWSTMIVLFENIGQNSTNGKLGIPHLPILPIPNTLNRLNTIIFVT